jgi:hypothetical protein
MKARRIASNRFVWLSTLAGLDVGRVFSDGIIKETSKTLSVDHPPDIGK